MGLSIDGKRSTGCPLLWVGNSPVDLFLIELFDRTVPSLMQPCSMRILISSQFLILFKLLQYRLMFLGVS